MTAVFKMSLNRAVVTAVYVSLYFGFICTQLELIPERGGVYEANQKYLNYAKIYVNRFGRKSGYYINMEFDLIYEINNNVTGQIVLFEKLGNQYKRSFVEFNFRLCDLINKDEFFGPTLRASGFVCPAAKGEHHLMNMTLIKINFPYKWPFEYARGDATFFQSETKEVIASGYLYVHIKQGKQKRQ